MSRMLLPTVLLVAVASFLTTRSFADEEDKKKAKPKDGVAENIEWKKGTAEFFKRLEGDFDLKVKDSKFVDGFKQDGEEVKGKFLRLLLEFKADVKSEGKITQGLPFAWGSTEDGPYLEFFYFDEEKVRILAQKHTSVYVDGDITGKKGEAFRVFVPLAEDSFLERTVRLEVHLHTLKKKAGKGKN